MEAEYWNHFFQEKQMILYLASSSSRREWILKRWGLEFQIYPAEFEEESFMENLNSIERKKSFWMVKSQEHKSLIHEICSNLAIQKALMVGDQLLKENQKKWIVLSADTMVYYNQYILTKPRTSKEAEQMLEFLSGKTHTVITSHCILNQQRRIITKDVMTLVTFRKLSKKEIQNYIQTKEPFDKAGGYAIQGNGGIFVEHIVGDYLNIVGLSLSAVKFLLGEI